MSDRPHCLVHDEGLPLQTCTCSGAASRSEQSAECPGPKCPLCSGEACNLCGTGALRCEPPCTHDSEERHREHQPAAEAAQSPQVGAAAVGYECVYCGTPLTPEPCEHIRQHVVVKWVAEPGRSTSDRPPVNPPVASADPELVKLLREARFHLSPHNAGRDLLLRIDSALSRLAGQIKDKPK